MSSEGYTHWCYQCLQPVRLRARNPVCSYCSGGFVQELDEVIANEQQDLVPMHPSDHGFADPRNRIMDAFAELIRQRMTEMDPNFGLRRRPGRVPERGVVPWFMLDGQAPSLMSANDGFEEFFNGFPPGILTGHGLHELIEQLTLNNSRNGPPPATRSAIDSMPTIRITNRHLNTDSHCPVCQDKFELGCEARQMPCNHIYHAACIVPWLVQHNSCPVCRLELPPQGTSGGGGSRGAENGGQSQGRRNPLTSFWPFRS